MPVAVEIEPHRFFDLLFPLMLQEKGAAARKLDAVIQFYLLDDIEGAWFADLTHDELPVVRGEHDAPDLTVHIESSCIDAMLVGELDVAAAVDDEQIAVHGDANVLAALAELFKGDQTWLEARAALNRAREAGSR